MKAVVGHPVAHQVVFVGPFGVGKTTAVQAISDTPVVSTEAASTAAQTDRPRGERKRTTTVGLDYGEWVREDGRVIAVIGTPGQERFSAVRRSAIPRGTTVVLWLYGQNDYALDEAREWLEYIAVDTSRARLAVAVTRLEQGDGPPLEAYRTLLDELHSDVPVLAADPRVRADVERVVEVALGDRLAAAVRS